MAPAAATWYTAWARWPKGGWQRVAEAPDMGHAHVRLLDVIRKRGMIPTASAVLPAGVSPSGLTNGSKDS
jgi:hypothetical protein